VQIPARNALAVGHMINHPPAEVSPNVLPFAYDFPPEGNEDSSCHCIIIDPSILLLGPVSHLLEYYIRTIHT
jgi:hypothetical protein